MENKKFVNKKLIKKNNHTHNHECECHCNAEDKESDMCHCNAEDKEGDKCHCNAEDKESDKCHCNAEDKESDKCHCNAEDKESDKCHCNAEDKESDKCHCNERVEDKKTKKNSEDNCCCGHLHEDKDESLSCCGHSHEDKEEASCGCCHSGAKSTLTANFVILAIALVALVVGFFNWRKIAENGNAIAMAFYYVNPSWLAVVLCGAPIFSSAIKILKKKKVNASVLISIGILASIGLEIASFFVEEQGAHSHSYVFAAGEIAFLMKIGEMLEDFTVGKCRSGIDRLVGLIPKVANVVVGGEIVVKNLANIAVGDIVVVKAGEMVSVDGEVVEGDGSIDTSSVTGEYLPQEVKVGDKVFGGTFNKSGVVYIKVEKLQKDMTIARMAELTAEAAGKKAPVSRLADKWVGYIVPTVFVVAIAVGLLSGFVFKIGIMKSFIRAITVLVVFCPCALALATPTAIAAGLGNSAKNGVLIKSGATLEELSRINCICLDKTGTLTEGIITVQEIVAIDSNSNFLKYIASVEKLSDHPIASAIVTACNEPTFDGVTAVQTLHGVGIVAQVNNKTVQILSLDNAIKNNVDIASLQTKIDGALAKGQTVVVGVIDGKLEGFVAVSDTIRQNAKAVVENLKEKNYEIMVLTGDNKQSALNVAELCGVESDNVRYSLLPQDKLGIVENLQNNSKKVCMLGDGINDAPALKLANCGIAMGALGSDIAIDSADVAIMNSDIAKLGDTLTLSKRVMNAIKRNIIIAMSINVVSVILSTFGLLTPVTGAIVHNVTSILVVASSSMLLFSKNRKKQKAKNDTIIQN